MVVGFDRNEGALLVDSLWEKFVPNLGICVADEPKIELWEFKLAPPNIEVWGDWKLLKNGESLEEELFVGVENKFDVDLAVSKELPFSFRELIDSCVLPKDNEVAEGVVPVEPNSKFDPCSRGVFVLIVDEVLVGCWKPNEVPVDCAGAVVEFNENEKLDWTVVGVEVKGVENIVVGDCAVVGKVKTDVVGVENWLLSVDNFEKPSSLVLVAAPNGDVVFVCCWRPKS